MVRFPVTRPKLPCLSEATPNDARIVFDLRNDPFIVALGQSGKAVLWEEHLAWFAQCLAAPELHRIYLISVNNDFGGVLRFDRKNVETDTISIFLREPLTGRGIGVEAIKLGCQRIGGVWPLDMIEAFVVAGNTISERAFLRVGFRLKAREQSGQTFVLETAKNSFIAR